MERTFYNVVATSPRSDGRAFFYANPLQQREPGADVRPDAVNPRAEGGVRAPWFDVSCCPTNVARTLASWQAYAAMVRSDDSGDVVSLVQHASADLNVALDGGGELALRVRTEYPADGRVSVEVTAAPERPVTLRLRVPHWAQDATLAGPGEPGPAPVGPGWAEVRRFFVAGDVVTLDLPTEPRFTWPHPRVDAVRGTVAVERGPLVLCLESVDLPDGVVIEDVRLDASVPPRAEGDGAVVTVAVVAPAGAATGRPPFSEHPPSSGPDATDASFGVPLVPYHRWAERGPSTMRVFVPTL
jgi:DUF1680 family protein